LEELDTGSIYNVTDRGLGAFAKLPKLKKVRLGEIPHESLTGLKSLKAAQELEELEFGIDQPKNEQYDLSHLAFLAELPKLRNLKVSASLHVDLRDGDLAFCRALSQVEKFELRPYEGGDAGLKELSGMIALKEFSLDCSSKCAITPAGIQQLAALPKLEALTLTDVPLKDEHLAPLAKVSVSSLELGSAKQLTLAGVQQLKEMPNLKRLQLNDSLLTDAELKTLREAMPGVGIVAY
jgi:hypothetical protein